MNEHYCPRPTCRVLPRNSLENTKYKILLACLRSCVLACLLACPYGNSTYMFFVRFLCTFCHVNLQESYLILKRVAVHTNTIKSTKNRTPYKDACWGFYVSSYRATHLLMIWEVKRTTLKCLYCISSRHRNHPHSEGIFMLYLYFSYKLLRLACNFQCTKVLNNVITTIR